MQLSSASSLHVGTGTATLAAMGTNLAWPYDPDASDLFRRINLAGSSIGLFPQAYITHFVISLKAASLWNMIYDMAVFVGPDTATGALQKLKTVTAYNTISVGVLPGYQATGSLAGFKGDGATMYLNTNTIPSNYISNSSGSLFTYAQGIESDSNFRWIISSQNGSGNITGLGQRASSNADIGCIAQSGNASGYAPNPQTGKVQGALMITTTGSGETIQYYQNGMARGGSSTPTSSVPPSGYPLILLAGSTAGVIQSYSTRYIRGYALCQQMNSSQIVTFSSLWNAMMTGMGANTY